MTPRDLSKLPYRDNVSCVVFKGNRFLLVQLLGWSNSWWKFPQGGIHEKESEEDTVRRELLEEVGIKNFKIIGKSSHTNKYDWSDASLKQIDYRWRGQFQRFFLVEYLGAEEEIKINKKELRQCRWMELENLFVSIDHKDRDFTNYKNSIKKVLSEFKII